MAKAAGAPRVYRRSDVEQVLRIKHLLLVEGLTLAGARRKLEEQTAPVAADAPVIDALIGRERARAADGGQARTAIDSGAADRFARRRRVPSRGAHGAARSVARPGDAGRADEGVARQGAGVAQRIGALSPSAPQAFGVRSARRDVA